MRDFKEQMEEARDRVERCRLRAERPNARLEDDFALEKARNRLLTLELRSLKSQLGAVVPSKGVNSRGDSACKPQPGRGSARKAAGKTIGTKHELLRLKPRDRAEAAFAALQKSGDAGKEVE